jgi:hypothetical protein
MSRHARRLLQERVAAQGGTEEVSDLPESIQAMARVFKAGQKMEALNALREAVDGSGDAASRLRARWALHLTGQITAEDAARWAQDADPRVRAWTVQTFFENSEVLFSQPMFEGLADNAVEAIASLAESDSSPVVRRAVASALQRLPVARRWDIAKALLGHAEDIGDHNLPLLYWYAIEGCVSSDATRAESLLKSCKIPKVREFIARRLAQMALAAN